MATTPPIRLHPSVRERVEPGMSATALAEYLILVADKQEDILHDSRWLQSHIGTYGDATRALRAYNLDPARSRSILTQAKEALTRRAAASSTTPKSRSNALLCIEAIELFERYENAFGMRALKLREPGLMQQTLQKPDRIRSAPSLASSPHFLVRGLMHEHVISGLVKRRSELACEIQEAHELLRKMIADLESIDRAILQFDPTYKVEEIRPKAFRPPKDWAQRHEMSRLILGILRRAAEPMTARDIAYQLLAERAMDKDDSRLMRLMTKRVSVALRHQRDNGVVRSAAGSGMYLVWEVTR